MSKSRGLARRTFLRGALATGSTLALGLPLLDAMTNLGGTALADGAPLPLRFAVWFWGNGMIHQDFWAPRGEGTGWAPSPILTPLERVRSHVSIVSGTTLPTRFEAHRASPSTEPRGNNPHVEGVTGILTGTNPYLVAGYDPARDWNHMSAAGPSIDQTMISVVGRSVHPSLTMAVVPLGAINGPGTALHFLSHRAAGDYIAPVMSPRALFDTLFGSGPPTTITPPTREELARASVLDAVRDDARSLERRLGASDRERLDRHLTQIRELEVTLLGGFADRATGEGCIVPGAVDDAVAYRDRARQFARLVALAFACDLTRVASICFSEPGSHTGYPGVLSPGLTTGGTSLHEYEHRTIFRTDAPDAAMVELHRHLIDCFADFVEELAAVDEAGGTIIDRTAVLGTSELTKGQTHDTVNFPLLVAGSAGGALRTGTHLRAPAGSIATQLPFTILRALGSTEPSWGQDQFRATEPLALLT